MAEWMTTTMTRGEETAMEMKLAGARAVVVGLGVTGRAAARFLADRGARVTASDARPRASLGTEVEELELDLLPDGAEVHARERVDVREHAHLAMLLHGLVDRLAQAAHVVT